MGLPSTSSIRRLLDSPKLISYTLVLILISACNHAPVRIITPKPPVIPRKEASLKAADITSITFIHKQVEVFTLTSPKDKADIERILFALQNGHRPKAIGKGGGRPDSIDIATTDPVALNGRFRIPTDFGRLNELLGPEVTTILDPMLAKPLADYKEGKF